LVDAFFEGSAESVVAALMGGEAARLSAQEIERIARIVEESRKEKQK
jgi:dihydrodipicolinate synthase/N-acetylneuraminate lyase